ncbi:glycosyltransferase family 29 protein [Atlantibacter sp.]|uniref:glycosyltransferase family 29 protein n=1 Tax=Atlantibacter sp. TaxID=1903473 RepID=UPI0028B202E3|nr:glycosyltransferase family 29 protein [Atlantibacter sp.]
MNLAAFFTESGSYDAALELANKAKEKDKEAWSKHRYLGLTFLLTSNDLLKDEWALKDSKLFLELSRNQWLFEDYITNNWAQVAIVGNAPKELHLKKGILIDQYEKVVRFNGAITEYPYSIDYGKKTNILVINPRYFETPRNAKYDLDFIIISDGNLYSSKNISLKLHDLSQFSSRICFLPRKLDISLTKRISASPSSGLKFLSWLYSINGPISRARIFGFSLTDQSYGVATSYSSGQRVGLNTIHNWTNEKEYLESIIK